MGTSDQYELVNSHDRKEDMPLYKEYSLIQLDNEWHMLLAPHLHGRSATDSGSMHRVKSPSPLDEIDARGTFQRREFTKKLKSMSREELEDMGISVKKVDDILRRADVRNTGEIDYRTFLEVVKNYRLKSEQESRLMTVARVFAFTEEFTCIPPTFTMIIITALELGMFVYTSLELTNEHNLEISWDSPVPYCSVLIYNPGRRREAWRFVSYMLVHIGIGHFVFNMIMQIVVGVFLEMEQCGWVGSLKVLAVYLSGVAAGSLGTSLSDPQTYIAGASGGVYALIAAHMATLALNWQEDSAVRIKKVIHKPVTRIIRLLFIGILTLHDVGYAIYVRLYSPENRTGFMGHLSGALAGLLVGVFILDNRRVKSWEPVIQWIAFLMFAAMLVFAVVWNIWGNTWAPGFFPAGDMAPLDAECRLYRRVYG